MTGQELENDARGKLLHRTRGTFAMGMVEIFQNAIGKLYTGLFAKLYND